MSFHAPSSFSSAVLDDQQQRDDERHAAVVAAHLPSGYTADFDGGVPADAGSEGQERRASQSAPDLTSAPEQPQNQQQQESSLLLQGGDIHRGLFKINARLPGPQRSQTFSHPRRGNDTPDGVLPTAAQLEPQGFRRQFVLQKRHGFTGGADLPVTRNFVEFLALYGAFAGEDLADSDDEEAIEDDEDGDHHGVDDRDRGLVATETRPLLPRSRSSRSAPRKGDAGTTKTFFTLLKAFIGTGIMFLPKAFNNGGILFSSMAMLFLAAVSMLAFHLLLQCRARYGGGYGDIGRAIAGERMRAIILGSVTLSQLGFVCTGLVFVADNWSSFLRAVTHGASPLTTTALIAIQAVLIVPLSFIRNISKLGPAALLADAFILIGLVYIYYYDVGTLATQGMHPSVRLFNPHAYTLTIGACIFTFEGIGLILPIQSSMQNPEKFEWLLGAVMLLITCIFTSVGALGYATFGSDTQIEVINNYPQDSKLVNAVQFMYALAVLIGNPVQLFPAMRILEGRIFGHRSGKRDLATKWKKNSFRALLVAVCIAVSIGGSANLDRFVALIGSVACVPLVYVYPAYLHYMGVAESSAAKAGDVAMMVLGVVGMVYTTVITILTSFMASPVGSQPGS